MYFIQRYLDTLKIFFFVVFYDSQLLPKFPVRNHSNYFLIAGIVDFLLFIKQVIKYLLILLSLFLCQPFFHVLGRRIGSKKTVGYVLAFAIVVIIITIALSIYVCLFQRRFIILKLVENNRNLSTNNKFINDLTKYSATSHFVWIIIHFIAGHWILINVVFNFYRAARMDPGRVPALLPYELVNIGGGVTMCKRCLIPRPPRAHHCGICRCCILRMDHHCPWLANCVGSRNHKNFFLFLFYFTLGGLYILFVGKNDFLAHFEELKFAFYNATDVNCLNIRNEDVFSYFSYTHAGKCTNSFYDNYMFSNILFFMHLLTASLYHLTIISVFASGSILIWHARLITRGETSIEVHLNKRFARRLAAYKNLVYLNLYDFGAWKNWTRFLGLVNSIYEEKTIETLNASSKLFGTSLFIVFYTKRFISRVMLPSTHLSIDSQGMKFELNFPSIEDILIDIDKFK